MANKLKVIIAGSRTFDNYGLLRLELDRWVWELAHSPINFQIEIVSGTAKGADRLGERYARENGYELRQFPADWDEYGKAAGPIRNSEMAQYGDVLFAFWDGESSGTRDMIEKARFESLEVHVIRYKEKM